MCFSLHSSSSYPSLSQSVSPLMQFLSASLIFFSFPLSISLWKTSVGFIEIALVNTPFTLSQSSNVEKTLQRQPHAHFYSVSLLKEKKSSWTFTKAGRSSLSEHPAICEVQPLWHSNTGSWCNLLGRYRDYKAHCRASTSETSIIHSMLLCFLTPPQHL